MLELKLEESEAILKENYGAWKFIVSKEGDVFYLHADPMPKGNKLDHITVAYRHNVENPLGGGFIYFRYGELSFANNSATYGSVPNSLMTLYSPLIRENLTKKGFKVKETLVNMWSPKDIVERRKWEELGFKFGEPS